MPPIGLLRHRVTLEAPVETPDGAGGVARSWQTLGEMWAAIEPVATGATVIADRRTARLTHRIVVRKRGDLSLDHRFRLGTRVFTLRSLRDAAEDGRFLECLVEEERT
jgi:SPP1 family predicted phage head-tail adaptor